MIGASETASPVVVGIAGKCCAGKDEVTSWLLDQGWTEVNVDRIGHEALAAKHREIVAAFGTEIVGDEAAIDRKALARRVFTDSNELRRLEEIVHPWMRIRVAEEVDRFRGTAATEGSGAPGLVINAALLFPMQLDHLCDAVVLVTAPLVQRLLRARSRRDRSPVQILRRLWVQRRLDAQAYRSPADTIIVENGHSRAALYRRLSEISFFHRR